MKSKRVKLVLVISLSLLLVVAFYNNTYADIKRREVKTPVKNIPFTPDIKVYSWQFGQAPVRMLRVSEGLCALTGVAGKFRCGGEQVYVISAGDYWILGGQSKAGYVWAQAHCIKYKDFGKDYASIKYHSTSDWLGCNSSYCANQNTTRMYYDLCRALFL